MGLFLLILLWFSLISLSVSDLKARVKRWDVVDAVRLQSKRSTINSPLKELKFRALDRDFHVTLTPDHSVLSSNFAAFRRTSDGSKERIPFYLDHLYKGQVVGEPNSLVSLQLDDDGSMMGSLQTEEEIFMLEPAWRHIPGSAVGSTLVYRTSDLMEDINHPSGLCGYVHVDQELMLNSSSKPEDSGNVREKRGLPDYTFVYRRNRCTLKLVADYNFFTSIGGNNEGTSIKYLIGLIDRVNTIYTNTVWRNDPSDPGFTGMGFAIQQIEVLQAYNTTSGHYNSISTDTPISALSLLESFSRYEENDTFCLVHLFTFRPLKDRVLGLGYIASPNIHLTGGICSFGSEIPGRGFGVWNTALSSLQSTSGGAVVTREADIVTAHEFGHNWGSHHDADSDECSPAGHKGGLFMMNPFSVSGYELNNRKFSPCSLRFIKSVLERKHSICFKEETASLCGNQRVEGDEECDAGLIGSHDNDPCCTADCRLRSGMKCSPINARCCSDRCQYRDPGFVCRNSSALTCKQETTCSGDSGDCPEAVANMLDGTDCLDKGQCRSGVCVSFCERKGIEMQPCLCQDNARHACYRCCSNGTHCRPFTRDPDFPVPQLLSKGTRCRHGVCNENGVCEAEVQDVAQRLWKLIEKLDVNAFLKFVKNNVVAVCIVVTLAFWIPASLVVSKIDKQRMSEREKEVEWYNSEHLVAEPDRIHVVSGIQSALRDAVYV